MSSTAFGFRAVGSTCVRECVSARVSRAGVARNAYEDASHPVGDGTRCEAVWEVVGSGNPGEGELVWFEPRQRHGHMSG